MNYYKYRFYLLFIITIGIINCFVSNVYKYNFIDIISEKINLIFKINIQFNIIFYILMLLSIVLLTSQLDFWLPFLGKSVLPSSLVPLKEPSNYNKIIKVKVKPNSKIAYWSTIPNTNNNVDVNKAYNQFENSGVVMSDNLGNAQLKILEGTGYVVPSGKKIERHVHYRVLGLEYGMMDSIQTINY